MAGKPVGNSRADLSRFFKAVRLSGPSLYQSWREVQMSDPEFAAASLAPEPDPDLNDPEERRRRMTEIHRLLVLMVDVCDGVKTLIEMCEKEEKYVPMFKNGAASAAVHRSACGHLCICALRMIVTDARRIEGWLQNHADVSSDLKMT